MDLPALERAAREQLDHILGDGRHAVIVYDFRPYSPPEFLHLESFDDRPRAEHRAFQLNTMGNRFARIESPTTPTTKGKP